MAQKHQLLHSLPIAAALAELHGETEVRIAATCDSMLDLARTLALRHAPGAKLAFDLLPLGFGDGARLRAGLGRTHFKQYTLLRNRRYFSGFDAVITPERTSLFLRTLGTSARLIWTRHGAGDRKIGFEPDVRAFDFVLMAGTKVERRLLERGLIHPGHYATGIYAKFDWARKEETDRLFGNGRRTILYNPHFHRKLSSWPRLGWDVLDALASSSQYNLIFAPHVRLFDAAPESAMRMFEDYAKLPHVRIDLGSERSIDMSYTSSADLYLGDVSSQVAEFLVRPRPCVFLDPIGRQWQDDPNYRFWTLGPVLRSAQRLQENLDVAFEQHALYLEHQRRYVEDTFATGPEPSAPRGAQAIYQYLHGRA